MISLRGFGRERILSSGEITGDVLSSRNISEEVSENKKISRSLMLARQKGQGQENLLNLSEVGLQV